MHYTCNLSEESKQKLRNNYSVCILILSNLDYSRTENNEVEVHVDVFQKIIISTEHGTLISSNKLINKDPSQFNKHVVNEILEIIKNHNLTKIKFLHRCRKVYLK